MDLMVCLSWTAPQCRFLHDMLHEVKPYADLYKTAYQTMGEGPPGELNS